MRLTIFSVVIGLSLAWSSFAHAQNRTVTGTVADTAGQPLNEIAVSVDGSNQGTLTDESGAFTLSVPKGPVVLRVQGEGFATVTVAVAARSKTLSVGLSALNPTRVVTGIVETPTGEALPGAAVGVADTGIRATTDERGLFVLEGVPKSTVTVMSQAEGLPVAKLSVGPDQTQVVITVGAEETEKRTIRGKVTEGATNEPVIGAFIMIPGTEATAITDETGSFEIVDAPEGATKLAIEATGYKSREVAVLDGVSEVSIGMKFATSEQILVIGRAPKSQRQNLANGASVVKSEDITAVTAQTLEDGLVGKFSGANLQRNSGAPGGGSDLRIRGISTILGSTSPLYVVDGVIVSNTSIASGVNVVTASGGPAQDNPVNRIADLNPNDIESVEILKGASAAALYGSKASNGVVIITTKRGKSGKAKVSITQRVGFSQLANKLGSRQFENLDEVPCADPTSASNCLRTTAAPYFDPATGAPLQVFDHEADLFNNNSLARETVASISGGNEKSNYFGSLLVRDEPGILRGTGYGKQSGRISVTQKLGKKLTLGFSTNLVHSISDRGLTQNDNAGVSHYVVLASTPNFVDLRRNADGSFPTNPFVPSETNPFQTTQLMTNSEEVWRLISSLNANLNLIDTDHHVLDLTSTLGVDWFHQQNELLFPPELHFEDKDGLEGTAVDGSAKNRNINVRFSAIHKYEPKAPLKLNSTFGLAYEERQLDRVSVIAQDLTAGQPNVSSGNSVEATEARLRTRERGAYLQEELLLLDDDLSIVGGVLGEQSSTNANENDVFFFPKASVAYKLPKLAKNIDLIRVRAAYGETGNQPTYGQRFTPLNARGKVEGIGTVRLTGRIGADDLRPERQREFDAGFDFSMGDGLLTTEFSAYQKNVSDLLLSRTPAPSTGYGSEFFNGGEMRVRGMEAMVELNPIKKKNFSWTSRTTFTRTISEITSLSVPRFDVPAGFGATFGAFRVEEGKSATQIVGNVPDADGNVSVQPIGNTEPDFRISFANNFKLGDFGIRSLWDFSSGGDVINLTRLLYDSSSLNNSADFEENGMERLSAFGTDARTYLEDATFLKLREVSLSYDIPSSIADKLGPMTNARVNLSGRNLLLISGYSGLDPEVSNFGNGALGRNIDVAPYPPSRSYWFSLSADF